MSTANPARRAVRRRRIGCQNCRNRRIKCDEKVPCGYCTRRRLDCNPTEFIVPNRWSTPSSEIIYEEPTPSSTATVQRSRKEAAPVTPIPESTYEIFQHVFSVDQPSTSSAQHATFTSDDILTEEKAGLLRFYQEGIGVWMDIFDRSHTYQNEVVQYSLSSPLLMHAVCALSAKQMSRIQNQFLWEPVSSRFYGESLILLINELTEQSTDRELLLAATILLGSYELLAQPGIDYQRHLYGARTLIFSHNLGQEGTLFEKASFWIYARQDVALALVNERPTLTPPAKWPKPPEDSASVEDRFGKTIIWLLARVIEAKFTPGGGEWSRAELESFQGLVSEIDLCWAGLPPHVRGVVMKQTHSEDEGLARVWFCVPSASAASLYYHMGKILAYECLLEKAASLLAGQSDEFLGLIGYHARTIASICLFSDLADGALVVAVNPIFFAAKYIPSMALKTRLWGVLDRIETRLGFYTRDRRTQLQLELKK